MSHTPEVGATTAAHGTPVEATGPARYAGPELAELADRVRTVAGVLLERAAIDLEADTGLTDRAAAGRTEFVTVTLTDKNKKGGGETVTLTVVDLAALAELAGATAAAEHDARTASAAAASVTHVVPDTMVQNPRGEWTGGRSVAGGWVRDNGAEAAPLGFQRLAVTLTATSNPLVARMVPLDGELVVHQIGVDGHVLSAGFRQLLPGGVHLGMEIPVEDVRFEYRPRP